MWQCIKYVKREMSGLIQKRISQLFIQPHGNFINELKQHKDKSNLFRLVQTSNNRDKLHFKMQWLSELHMWFYQVGVKLAVALAATNKLLAAPRLAKTIPPGPTPKTQVIICATMFVGTAGSSAYRKTFCLNSFKLSEGHSSCKEWFRSTP